ncbi:hypothetical protein SGCOL_008144 [Colletotrichum sp. CLE4]
MALAPTALTSKSDLQHNLFLLTLDNKLGLAPPNAPDSRVKRVLDVGTGTGIWAVDFGDEHPEAEEYDVFVKSDDDTLKPDHAVSRCVDLIYDASIKFGRPYQDIEPLAEMMKEVGFVDVALHNDKWPSNAWARDPKYKELGMWNHENMSSGVEGFTMAAFTRIHNWTKDEVQAFLVDVRKDLKDKSIHGYWTV